MIAKKVLVVGAGVSGVRSALDLAGMGYGVVLIDRAPHLLGALGKLDYQFPSDHCGMCKMLPLVDRDSASEFCLRKGLFHERIEIKLETELVGLEGGPGNFLATLRQKPSLIDPERCIGCGECSRVCPTEVRDEFNAGLGKRKAVFLPLPHSIPNHYVIDETSCTRCGACEKACPTGAVSLGLDARKSFRILVVDDELIVRDSIKEWLEDEGFSVDMAESGFEALEKLSKGPFDLMLVDVKMPGMDGVEVLKRSKEISPGIPVVMMTAYATVETAVEAMKVGAFDYLMKPFDPEGMISLVLRIYTGSLPSREQKLEVGAIVLSAGFGSCDPAVSNDTYGYGEIPRVVTSMEFERILSGTGPTAGRLLFPKDGTEIRKIAWIQCVGSRSVDTDYCSSICCMFSLKEAVLAKEKSGGTVDTTIFYMDMRTFGKGFEKYRQRAEKEFGVRFVRSRVHSVEPEGPDFKPRIEFADLYGAMRDETFDLVVLATGQKPPEGTESLAEMAGLERNPWGFCRASDFSLSRTSREGVLIGGSFGGLRDISESIIQAGSASLGASALIHSKGGGIGEVAGEKTLFRNVSRELPQVAIGLCTCGTALGEALDLDALADGLMKADSVVQLIQIERLCTREGWNELKENLQRSGANRVLLGACMPYVYGRKLKELGESIGLSPELMDVVDIRTPQFVRSKEENADAAGEIAAALKMGAARLRMADSCLASSTRVIRKALVVGGGVAGMSSALAIADHGFEVYLIEKDAELGGNLRNLSRTLENASPRELLQRTVERVEKHPLIHAFRSSRVIRSQGEVGNFTTTVEGEDGVSHAIEHGVTILATGGREARTASYCHGQSENIVTQHELEEKLESGAIDPSALQTVVMIQCVDSREGDRNYCSRICCVSSLKNALYLKEKNQDIDVYVFYRDLMAYGFYEAYYTKARKAGVVFIQYVPERRPEVGLEDGKIAVSAVDPILGREIVLRPDLLVLSTGIVPGEGGKLAEIFGVEVDENGFFREAESKWRPVDFLKGGVFVAGLAHSPRSITESIAMAEAAAQRALSIIGPGSLSTGWRIAEVRHSLCSLCERCLEACPYGARSRGEEEERILINELLCRGCGSCAAVCPNSASFLRGYRDHQVFAMLEAALE